MSEAVVAAPNEVVKGTDRVALGYARTFNAQTLMDAQTGIPGYTDAIAVEYSNQKFLTLSASTRSDAGYAIWEGTITDGEPLGRFCCVITVSGMNDYYVPGFNGDWFIYYWDTSGYLQKIQKTFRHSKDGITDGVVSSLWTIAPIV